ncbi:MAG: polysaccharide deacetylase family protein [Acidobacteriia bacterium]|nr:polysaccharide deacetylase family protein [Terriglobia bacterium]
MLWRQRWASQGGPLVQVVEMHETLQRDAGQLRRQLEWVAERFTLISPETFFELWDRTRTPPKWPKPAVLFTFDDGRASNYTVAAPMLESMGARGLFFVVPEFIGLAGRDARDFYYSRIDVRGLAPSDSAEHWTPMNPDQLADLTRRGHSIGNHTLSHVSLAGLSPADLEHQIAASAAKISSWTRKSVEAFAWPYSWNAINREAWDLIRKTHRFCFTPCPGTASYSKDSPHLIWRTEIEAYYSDSQYRFMYSGLANPAWARRRRQLKAILGA